jgi:hypothetical protein
MKPNGCTKIATKTTDLREPNLVTSKNICRAAPSVSNGVVTLLLDALVTRGF